MCLEAVLNVRVLVGAELSLEAVSMSRRSVNEGLLYDLSCCGFSKLDIPPPPFHSLYPSSFSSSLPPSSLILPPLALLFILSLPPSPLSHFPFSSSFLHFFPFSSPLSCTMFHFSGLWHERWKRCLHVVCFTSRFSRQSFPCLFMSYYWKMGLGCISSQTTVSFYLLCRPRSSLPF